MGVVREKGMPTSSQKENMNMKEQKKNDGIKGFAFVFKLVEDGKDFQIGRVCVAGSDRVEAEKEARETMLKRSRQWPDEIVLTHCEQIGG